MRMMFDLEQLAFFDLIEVFAIFMSFRVKFLVPL